MQEIDIDIDIDIMKKSKSKKEEVMTVGDLKKLLKKYPDGLKVGLDTYGPVGCSATPIGAVYRGFDWEAGWLLFRTKPPMKRVALGTLHTPIAP